MRKTVNTFKLRLYAVLLPPLLSEIICDRKLGNIPDSFLDTMLIAKNQHLKILEDYNIISIGGPTVNLVSDKIKEKVTGSKSIKEGSASTVGETAGGDNKTKDLNSAQEKIRHITSDTQITDPTKNLQEKSVDEADGSEEHTKKLVEL